ncbi:hypothetical protein C8R46DRAFT_1342568 [Mycena filopes]|nr:hypothetical protein C8R46DRAFT_1342568 [Mycena filopes]
MLDAPSFEWVMAPFCLCQLPLVSIGHLGTVTLTHFIAVVNPFRGAVELEQQVPRRAPQPPAALFLCLLVVSPPAPVTVVITEPNYKPYDDLDKDAKCGWDPWNAQCELLGGFFSSFGMSGKTLGKRRALEPLVHMTNPGRHKVGGGGDGRKERMKKSRRRSALHASSSRTARSCFTVEILPTGVGLAWARFDMPDTICLRPSPRRPYHCHERDTTRCDDPGGVWARVKLLLSVARYAPDELLSGVFDAHSLAGHSGWKPVLAACCVWCLIRVLLDLRTPSSLLLLRRNITRLDDLSGPLVVSMDTLLADLAIPRTPSCHMDPAASIQPATPSLPSCPSRTRSSLVIAMAARRLHRLRGRGVEIPCLTWPFFRLPSYPPMVLLPHRPPFKATTKSDSLPLPLRPWPPPLPPPSFVPATPPTPQQPLSPAKASPLIRPLTEISIKPFANYYHDCVPSSDTSVCVASLSRPMPSYCQPQVLLSLQNTYTMSNTEISIVPSASTSTSPNQTRRTTLRERCGFTLSLSFAPAVLDSDARRKRRSQVISIDLSALAKAPIDDNALRAGYFA